MSNDAGKSGWFGGYRDIVRSTIVSMRFMRGRGEGKEWTKGSGMKNSDWEKGERGKWGGGRGVNHTLFLISQTSIRLEINMFVLLGNPCRAQDTVRVANENGDPIFGHGQELFGVTGVDGDGGIGEGVDACAQSLTVDVRAYLVIVGGGGGLRV